MLQMIKLIKQIIIYNIKLSIFKNKQRMKLKDKDNNFKIIMKRNKSKLMIIINNKSMIYLLKKLIFKEKMKIIK